MIEMGPMEVAGKILGFDLEGYRYIHLIII